MSAALDKLLTDQGACVEACEWASAHKGSVRAAWDTCPRGDWLLWIAARVGVDRALVVRAAAACARTTLHLVREQERPVCLSAIETAERYSRGEATQAECQEAAREARRAASSDASASAYAAAASADAASAYAASAASAAAYAASADAASAYAASDADREARAKALAVCADKVREVISYEVVAKAAGVRVKTTQSAVVSK